ncbi:MoaD/ThiS family protein [Nakamurella flava]|uniref:Molybdopterin synthase sulfur carrier subunit n=1 Tax=Nakamurella flava TaxID=2576308 RepID=A0A4V6CWD1_9ACTN|nr:MoaD/ThiS family protein [Nakamurella flava]TKV61945.1 MoaD/ThiS family protein [Nakamurella flava]
MTEATTTVPSDGAAAVTRVEVRLFAAARAAAQTSATTIEVPGDATVAHVLDAATARHPGLAAVLPRCSYLLDQVAVHGRETPIGSATTLDVLPPFAGG